MGAHAVNWSLLLVLFQNELQLDDSQTQKIQQKVEWQRELAHLEHCQQVWTTVYCIGSTTPSLLLLTSVRFTKFEFSCKISKDCIRKKIILRYLVTLGGFSIWIGLKVCFGYLWTRENWRQLLIQGKLWNPTVKSKLCFEENASVIMKPRYDTRERKRWKEEDLLQRLCDRDRNVFGLPCPLTRVMGQKIALLMIAAHGNQLKESMIWWDNEFFIISDNSVVSFKMSANTEPSQSKLE